MADHGHPHFDPAGGCACSCGDCLAIDGQCLCALCSCPHARGEAQRMKQSSRFPVDTTSAYLQGGGAYARRYMLGPGPWQRENQEQRVEPTRASGGAGGPVAAPSASP